MNEAEWAWLAGLYEGEGCLAFTNVHSLQLVIRMTDRDVIHRCYELTGLGWLGGRENRGPNKPMWCWSVTQQDAIREVLTEILPWLGERRRARVLAGLERMAGIRRTGFCKRGHLLDEYGEPNGLAGQRTCGICKRARHNEVERRNRVLQRLARAKERGMNQQMLEEAQDKMAMAESIRQQLIGETDPDEVARLESDYELVFDEGRQAVLAAMDLPEEAP